MEAPSRMRVDSVASAAVNRLGPVAARSREGYHACGLVEAQDLYPTT